MTENEHTVEPTPVSAPLASNPAPLTGQGPRRPMRKRRTSISFKPRRPKMAISPPAAETKTMAQDDAPILASPAEAPTSASVSNAPPPPSTLADTAASTQPAPLTEIGGTSLIQDVPPVEEAEALPAASPIPVPEPAPAKPPPASHQPQPIELAITETEQVIETLKGVLDELEEVLDLLECVKEEKNADERQIQSLRQQLRALQQTPYSGGQSTRKRTYPNSH